MATTTIATAAVNVERSEAESTLSEKHTPLAAQARRFIAEHRLTLSELKYSQSFCALPRREKDAIRYQLKKLPELGRKKVLHPNRPQKSKKREEKRLKIFPSIRFVLGLWIALFLMGDLMSFYKLKGYSGWTALQMAFLVEAAIICCCLSRRRILRICAYGLFVYNGLIFSGYVFESAKLADSTLESQRLSMGRKQEKIRRTQADIHKLYQEKKEHQRNLSQMIQSRWISRGEQIYLPMIHRVESAIKIKEEALGRFEAESLQGEQGKNSTPHGPFGVFLLIFIRLILQFVSLQFFHGFRARIQNGGLGVRS